MWVFKRIKSFKPHFSLAFHLFPFFNGIQVKQLPHSLQLYVPNRRHGFDESVAAGTQNAPLVIALAAFTIAARCRLLDCTAYERALQVKITVETFGTLWRGFMPSLV